MRTLGGEASSAAGTTTTAMSSTSSSGGMATASTGATPIVPRGHWPLDEDAGPIANDIGTGEAVHRRLHAGRHRAVGVLPGPDRYGIRAADDPGAAGGHRSDLVVLEGLDNAAAENGPGGGSHIGGWPDRPGTW